MNLNNSGNSTLEDEIVEKISYNCYKLDFNLTLRRGNI